MDNTSENESIYQKPVPVFRQIEPVRNTYKDSFIDSLALENNNTRDSSSFILPLDTTPVREGPLIQKIELEEIDITENKDAKILNKDEYFTNYEINKVSISEPSCNKICLSHDSKYLYCAGPDGLIQFEVQNSSDSNSINSNSSTKPALTQSTSLNT